MSDQWGQQPQNPYGGGAPQGPYNQPQQPPQPQQPQQPQSPYYGQPLQQPQGPYGQPPQPGPAGPYGPAQPQNPYGLPPAQPIQQPQFPQQFPANPYDPYGQQQPGYGFPQQPGPSAAKKNQNMIISGAVVGVLIIAAVIFFVVKGNGSSSGSGGIGTGTSTNAGSQTQTQSCASWKAEQNTMNNQNPNTESDMVSMLAQDVPAMEAISREASAGPFKTDMSKVVIDFSELYTYLQANPNLDTSTSTPPAEFISIEEAITADASKLDSLCGLPNLAASGNNSGGSGF